MSTQIKFRRDTRENLLLSTPVEGEIGVDTTNDRLILGDGVSSGGIPQASYHDIQNNKFTAVDASGVDALTLTFPDAPTAYAEYQSFTFKPASNNTGAVTVNINGLGIRDIKKDDGSGILIDLQAGDLKANIPVSIIYDGFRFILELGGGAGGLQFLGSYTASGDTSVDIGNALDLDVAIDSSYDCYELHIVGLVPATDGAFLQIRTSSNTGGTFDSAFNHYSWGTIINRGSDATSRSGDNQDAEIFLATTGRASGESMNATIKLFSPSDSFATVLEFSCSGADPSSSIVYERNHYTGIGIRRSEAIVDALRVFMSGGNIDSADFYLYGYKRA